MITPSTPISLSLTQLILASIFIISATFSGGLAYSKLTSTSADLVNTQNEVVEIKSAIVKIGTAIELMQQQQSIMNSDVKQSGENISKINYELVTINSHISEMERKRR